MHGELVIKLLLVTLPCVENTVNIYFLAIQLPVHSHTMNYLPKEEMDMQQNYYCKVWLCLHFSRLCAFIDTGNQDYFNTEHSVYMYIYPTPSNL